MQLSAPKFWRAESGEGTPMEGFSTNPGIYVVESNEKPGVFRFGKKQDCVVRRIKQHGGPKGKYINITGDLMPYSAVMLWALPKWPPFRIAMAENIMFCEIERQNCEKYHSDERGGDKSNYIVSSAFDWDQFVNRVGSELAAIVKFGD